MEEVNLDGCDICAENHDTLECPHLVVNDTVEEVDPNALNLSRARLSLPHFLDYMECEDGMCQIVTKTTIKAKTKLGPFEARKTRQSLEIENAFILKIFLKDGTGLTLDTTDEEECNWLCLVSAARNSEEQNCLVVQLGIDIYYMTMCNIAPDTPLKVWYAPHYARKLGKMPQPDGMSVVLLGCVLSHQLTPVTMLQYDNTPHKFMQLEHSQEDIQGEENKMDAAGDSEDPAAPNEKAAVYKCSQCVSFLPTEYALQLHKATHATTSAGSAVSEEGMDVIQTALAITGSMVDSVNAIASPRVDKIQHSAENETHICLRCPETFGTMQELAIHVREHLADETPKRAKGRHRKLPLVIQPSEQASDKTTQTLATSGSKLKKYATPQVQRKEQITSDFEVESEVDVHNVSHVPHVPSKTIIRTRRQLAHEEGAQMALAINQEGGEEKEKSVEKTFESRATTHDASETDKRTLETESDSIEKSHASKSSKNTNEEDCEESQEIAPPAKRGRGRPRKYPKVNAADDDEKQNETKMAVSLVRKSVDDPKDSKATPMSRKRGRPRKTPPPPNKVPKLDGVDSLEAARVDSADCVESNGSGEVDKNASSGSVMIDLMNDASQNLHADAGETCNSVAEISESDNGRSTDLTEYASRQKEDLRQTPTEAESKLTAEIVEPPDAALKVLRVKVGEDKVKSREVKPRAERLHRVIQSCNMDVSATGTVEYSCKECKVTFNELANFEEHMKDHVGEYVCSKCKKTFKRMDALCYHLCRAPISAEKVDVHTCRVCGKVFDKLKGLTRHMNGHLGKYRCDKCGVVFARKENFDRHSCGTKQAADPSLVEKHVCEFCGASFNKRKYLLRHMAMHTGEFACKVCSREFARKESLMQHQLKCDPDIICQEGHTIFRCKLCNRVFAKEVSLQNHMMLHTEDHKCTVCGKCFASQFSLVKHKCVGESAVVVDGESSSTVFKCTVCDKSFSKHLYLKRHMDMHSGQYSCIFCNESFARRDDLNRHLVDCTAMTQLSAKGRVECPTCMESFEDKEEFRSHYELHTHPFMCEICQKRFIRKANLDTHECTPWDEDPVSCEVCGKEFQHPKFLQRHRVVHAEAKFKCLICARRFLSVEQLEKHTELCPDAHNPKKRSWKTRERKVGHKQEEQCICPTCGKSYASVSNLNKHIVTHGEKNEQCALCHKMFHLKVNLKEHMRMVHTVEKKFECKYCGKKMKSRNSVYGHIRQFHQNTLFIYQCDQCNRSFRQKGNLKKHVLMHSLEKFYSCGKCERKFKYCEQLRRHEKWHEQGYTHSCDHCNKKFVMKFELDRHIDTQHKGLVYICCYCQTECRHVHTMMRHLRRRHTDRFEWQQNIRQFCDGLRQHVTQGKKGVKRSPQSILPTNSQPKALAPGSVTIQPQSTLDMTQLGELLQSTEGSSDQPYIIAEVCQLGQDDAMSTHTVIMCSGGVDTENLQQQLQTAFESLAQEGETQENFGGTTMTIIGDISSTDGQTVPVAYSEPSLQEDQGCFIVPMRKNETEKAQELSEGPGNVVDGNSLKSDAISMDDEFSPDNVVTNSNETENEVQMRGETIMKADSTIDAQVTMDTSDGLHDDQVANHVANHIARGDIHVVLQNSDHQIVMEDPSGQVVIDDDHNIETSHIAIDDGQIVIDENSQIVLEGDNRVIMDDDNQIVVDSNQVILNGNQMVVDRGQIVIDGRQVILDDGQIVVSEDQAFSEVTGSMDTIEQVVYGEYIV